MLQLLTTIYGFHPWYIEQLPKVLQEKAKQLIFQQVEAITKLKVSEEDRQYFIAMGFRVPCRFSFDIPALVYFIELRSGKLVHPTLRPIAHAMHHAVRKAFPMILLHSNLDADNWDIQRGLQDITKKKL